jgi:hypothetical protein
LRHPADEICFSSLLDRGRATLVEEQRHKAVRFTFDKNGRSIFFTGNPQHRLHQHFSSTRTDRPLRRRASTSGVLAAGAWG